MGESFSIYRVPGHNQAQFLSDAWNCLKKPYIRPNYPIGCQVFRRSAGHDIRIFPVDNFPGQE